MLYDAYVVPEVAQREGARGDGEASEVGSLAGLEKPAAGGHVVNLIRTEAGVSEMGNRCFPYKLVNKRHSSDRSIRLIDR